MSGGREKNAWVYERKFGRGKQKQGERRMYGDKDWIRTIMRAEVKE